ncbi:MAG: hypothetical protein SLRJCFUN_000271 [Candidatus Fervidibacter sp.]|jgi:hypothetical protein
MSRVGKGVGKVNLEGGDPSVKRKSEWGGSGQSLLWAFRSGWYKAVSYPLIGWGRENPMPHEGERHGVDLDAAFSSVHR